MDLEQGLDCDPWLSTTFVNPLTMEPHGEFYTGSVHILTMPQAQTSVTKRKRKQKFDTSSVRFDPNLESQQEQKLLHKLDETDPRYNDEIRRRIIKAKKSHSYRGSQKSKIKEANVQITELRKRNEELEEEMRQLKQENLQLKQWFKKGD